jgi:pentatricopeptide repeat protein
MTLLVRRSLLLLGLAALRARPLQMRLSRTQDGKFLKRLRHAPTTHSVDRILGEIRRSPATVDQQQKHFEAAIVTASHVGTAKDPLRLLTAMRRELGRPPARTFTYTQVLRSCARGREWEAALRVLRAMAPP